MRLFPSLHAYLLLLAMVLTDAVWLVLTDYSVRPDQLLRSGLLIAALALGMPPVAYRASRDPQHRQLLLRIGCLLQGVAFLSLAWAALRVFNHLSMTTDLPYADAMLSSWDAALGLDWHAYFAAVQASTPLALLLDASYRSLTTLSFLGFCVLFIRGDMLRLRFFLETFLVTAVACTVLGMFFPARAAVATHFPGADVIQGFDIMPGIYHLEHLERLRTRVGYALDLDALPGLVTFPSFHTAGGVVLAACFLRTRLFPVVLAYTLAMIASTPVFGGHYFVDIFAGTAVALLVLVVYARRPAYAGLLARPSRAGRAGGREAANPLTSPT